MITVTAKEIISKAKYFGNVRNSNTNDFDTCITILNNEYLNMYYDIIKESNSFTKYFDFDGEETPLPEDCYLVLGVYIKGSNSDTMRIVTASPINQFVSAEYKLENNTIKIVNPSKTLGRYVLKYAPVPATITAPDDMVKLLNFPSNFTATVAIDEDSMYVKSSGNWYTYTISTDTLVETTHADVLNYSQPYLDGTVSAVYNNDGTMGSSVYYTDSDGVQTTPFAITGKTINYFQCDNPYAIVSYTDGTVYIFTGLNGNVWNQLAYTGHDTLGKAVYIITNDLTGKGIVFYNNRDQSFYYCSFVPDTVFTYPNNIFFQLLEYRIGSIMASIIGINTQYLNTILIPRAEQQFYDSVKKDAFLPTRVMNVNENFSLI